MNRIMLILGLVLVKIVSFAGTPPAAVQKAFSQKFPAATNVKWGKENAKEWEGEFKINSTKLSANFSDNGTWLETETEIPLSQLPPIVVSSINEQYPDWEIVGADKIERSKDGILYEADIKSGIKKKEVLLKSNGIFF